MPKKTNTRRADGRIVVQVYVGSVDGKRKYKSVYGKTQKEADQKAAELRAQLHRGVDLISENRTFAFWANRFLISKKTPYPPAGISALVRGSITSYSILASLIFQKFGFVMFKPSLMRSPPAIRIRVSLHRVKR